jgi:hypothetical protein
MKQIKDEGERHFEETVKGEHGFVDTEEGCNVETGGRAWIRRHQRG